MFWDIPQREFPWTHTLRGGAQNVRIQFPPSKHSGKKSDHLLKMKDCAQTFIGYLPYQIASGFDDICAVLKLSFQTFKLAYLNFVQNQMRP